MVAQGQAQVALQLSTICKVHAAHVCSKEQFNEGCFFLFVMPVLSFESCIQIALDGFDLLS